jgi:hypothetical protein
MGDHQGRLLQLLDHAGHAESLAGACCAEEHLVFKTLFYAIHQFLDGFRLVAGGDERSL